MTKIHSGEILARPDPLQPTQATPSHYPHEPVLGSIQGKLQRPCRSDQPLSTHVCRPESVTHNPEVAGSNPAPATTFPQVSDMIHDHVAFLLPYSCPKSGH